MLKGEGDRIFPKAKTLEGRTLNHSCSKGEGGSPFPQAKPLEGHEDDEDEKLGPKSKTVSGIYLCLILTFPGTFRTDSLNLLGGEKVFTAEELFSEFIDVLQEICLAFWHLQECCVCVATERN